MEINFEIGRNIKHKISIFCSIFGLEIYKVDGKEILKTRSFAVRGNQKFTISDNENKYEIEIKYDMLPKAKSWLFPENWIAQVYVNGELLVSDLTPALKETVRKVNRESNKILLFWLIILLAALASLVLKKFLH